MYETYEKHEGLQIVHAKVEILLRCLDACRDTTDQQGQHVAIQNLEDRHDKTVQTFAPRQSLAGIVENAQTQLSHFPKVSHANSTVQAGHHVTQSSLQLQSRQASSLLFLRYVDNRLILAPSHILQHPQIQKFCLSDFNEGIQLESVEDHQWLGFTIDTPARTAIFNLPTKPWQVRSPASAGSWQLAASGFFSRAALIRQYAWPKESALPQIRALQDIYVQAGFPKDSVPVPRVH